MYLSAISHINTRKSPFTTIINHYQPSSTIVNHEFHQYHQSFPPGPRSYAVGYPATAGAAKSAALEEACSGRKFMGTSLYRMYHLLIIYNTYWYALDWLYISFIIFPINHKITNIGKSRERERERARYWGPKKREHYLLHLGISHRLERIAPSAFRDAWSTNRTLKIRYSLNIRKSG